MRVFVLILLMLLLPLRAWAGDAMALSMVQGAGAAALVMPADHTAHDMHDGHDGHDMQAGHAAHNAAPQAADDCPSHVACDVCNGPVLSLPVWKAEGAVARHRPSVTPSSDFASLVPHRRHKPPIA